MPTVTDSSVKPTTVVKPDSRFATTFLSTKYRDRAVPGEVLMDKITGELYIKRVSDGKIVSFNQNKKMINDLVLELQLLLFHNNKFVYPSESETSFYVVTNYDLVTINNEVLYDLTFDNIIIPESSNDINKLTFKISGGSNGFFCRHATRDVDKPFIEFITSQYNSFFKNYTGDDAIYEAEHAKFTTIDKWESSNATITYSVDVYKDGTKYEYKDNIGYITLNEDSAVLLPEKIYEDLTSFDYAEITINGISYDKLHFMFNYKNCFDDTFKNGYDKLISIDSRIEVAEFIVSHFINDITHMEFHGNESIVGFLDMPHLQKSMSNMTRFLDQSPFHISGQKPAFACAWFNTNTD